MCNLWFCFMWCSLMPWRILSSTSFVIQILACQMADSFHHYLISNPMVCWFWKIGYRVRDSGLFLFSLIIFWLTFCMLLVRVPELKGVPSEILVKLVPEHARKQCPFLGSWSVVSIWECCAFLFYLIWYFCWYLYCIRLPCKSRFRDTCYSLSPNPRWLCRIPCFLYHSRL